MKGKLTLTVDGTDSHGNEMTRSRTIEVDDIAEIDRLKGLVTLYLEHLVIDFTSAAANGSVPEITVPAAAVKPKRAAKTGRR